MVLTADPVTCEKIGNFDLRGGEEIVKYDGVTLNAGRGLNPATGIFIAPQVKFVNFIIFVANISINQYFVRNCCDNLGRRIS